MQFVWILSFIVWRQLFTSNTLRDAARMGPASDVSSLPGSTPCWSPPAIAPTSLSCSATCCRRWLSLLHAHFQSRALMHSASAASHPPSTFPSHHSHLYSSSLSFSSCCLLLLPPLCFQLSGSLSTPKKSSRQPRPLSQVLSCASVFVRTAQLASLAILAVAKWWRVASSTCISHYEAQSETEILDSSRWEFNV